MYIKSYFIPLIAFTFIIFGACQTQEFIPVSADPQGYVGGDKCVACHMEETQKWKGSHHDWAMKIAADSTVKGNFDSYETTLDSVSYRFYREGKDFMVHIREIDHSESTYKIEYTFGIAPLQQYIVDFEGGKRQVMRATWDTEKGVWFHQYTQDKIEPDNWLHWTRGGQRWNTMCAECHSTNLQKNYNIPANAFNTTYHDINVTCEACHGPGKEHLENVQKGLNNNNYHLNPTSQSAVLNTCMPCHARREALTGALTPRENFDDQYHISLLTSNFYFPDGQIKEEDYVAGSFMQSKMFTKNIKCNDCHDSHSMQLKQTGNKLCLQCHEPKYNSKGHHFHNEDEEGGQCINCHMTGRYYMGNDYRHDHSFRVPRPDQSVDYNTPNACTGCHKDKDNQWAATAVETWYGKERQAHFSDILLWQTKPHLTKVQQLTVNKFINNTDYPFLARATAISTMVFPDSKNEVEALLRAMNDSAALVRHHALRQMRLIAPKERAAIAFKHLNDSSRLARIAVAQLLNDIPADSVPTSFQGPANAARSEWISQMNANADHAIGRMNLGDFYSQQKRYHEAIAQYQIALKMDSLLLPVYGNFATALSVVNKPFEALNVLTQLLKFDPNNARGYYLRALLNAELENTMMAVADLETAIQLSPENLRYVYNLGALYLQLDDVARARKLISTKVQEYPNWEDGKQFLKAIEGR